MKISSNGIAVLKYFEDCHLKAYPDPATGGAPWTIGWGHTGPEVKRGLVWTQNQADDALVADLARFERAVSAAVHVPLNQGQFDALVSFTYNLGEGNLKSSTLLKMVNAGNFAGAAEQFKRWNKANGKTMRGLTRRRAAEQCLFLGMGGASAIERGVAAA